MMIARATNGLILSVLVLGLYIITAGRPAYAAEGARSGEFRIAQARQPGEKLTKEERQKRRAARQKRQQERAAKKAAKPAAQRNPNREGARRAARPAPAARPAARPATRPARPARPARAAQPARPNRAARPARRQAAPPQRRAARPAPKRKRRSPFRKLERNVRKFIKKEFRGDRRRDERRAAEARRAEQARRSAARQRSFEGRPFLPRDADRRQRRRDFNDGRRFDRREASRDFREFRRPEVRRRELRRGRVNNRRAARRYARSRRHLIRSQRYRNRFNGGYSVYYLPPAGVALAAGLYALDSSRASYDDYFDTFMAPPVRRLGRRYSMDEIVTDPELRAAVRSVNIDVITFYSGSARIAERQLDQLEDLADAIHATLRRRPDEVFLIAGHTDAVGPFDENLDLSERRAAAVLDLLVNEFGVPERNLEAVGYGEQYLRVNTYGPDRRNRRVVVRAIGSLLAYRR